MSVHSANWERRTPAGAWSSGRVTRTALPPLVPCALPGHPETETGCPPDSEIHVIWAFETGTHSMAVAGLSGSS